MPFYHYKAASSGGEVIEGRMEADDRETVVRRLQAQGHVPIRAELISAGQMVDAREGRSRRRGRVGRRQLGVFTLELATLLEAGLPLERSLRVLGDLAESEALYEMVSSLRSDVRGGRELSGSMETQYAKWRRLMRELFAAETGLPAAR